MYNIYNAVLLHCLRERFGSDSQVPAWLESYLTDRHQKVSITYPVLWQDMSVQVTLTYGLPQGSFLVLSYLSCIRHSWVTYAENTILTSCCVQMTSNVILHLSQGHRAAYLTVSISYNCALQKSGNG